MLLVVVIRRPLQSSPAKQGRPDFGVLQARAGFRHNFLGMRYCCNAGAGLRPESVSIESSDQRANMESSSVRLRAPDSDIAMGSFGRSLSVGIPKLGRPAREGFPRHRQAHLAAETSRPGDWNSER